MGADISNNKIKWLITSFGLIFLSGVAGLSGYLFNFLISKVWDTVTLGEIIGVVGAITVCGLPATLLILPVAKWSIQTKEWKKKIPIYQFYSLVIGILLVTIIFLTKSLWGNWLIVPEGWLLPALLWCAPIFMFYFQMGVFMGRRAYWWMAIVGAVPQIGKVVVLLSAFFHSPLLEDPSFALWAIAIPKVVATVLGVIGIYRIQETETKADIPTSLWASGWVSIATNVWMSWDSTVAYMILPASGIAIYGVVSTLGKIPFFLANNVANMGINEKVLGKARKYGTEMIIIGLGVCTILGFLVVGDFALSMFGLNEGKTSMMIFMAANTVLSLIYYQLGVDAQQGKHSWYPLVIVLLLWTSWALLTKPDHVQFVSSLAIALLIAWGGILWLKTRYNKQKAYK